MMARLHAFVLITDFSAIARLVLSRRTGLSTGPNRVLCPAGIGSSACPHIIGTSLWVVGVSVGLVPRSEIFQSPDSHTTAMMPLLTFSLISMYLRSMCRFPSVIIVSFAQSLAFLLSVSVNVGRSTHSGKPKSLIISRTHLIHIYICMCQCGTPRPTEAGSGLPVRCAALLRRLALSSALLTPGIPPGP